MKTPATSSPRPDQPPPQPKLGPSENRGDVAAQEADADALIVAALTGKLRRYPSDASMPETQLLVERVDFHGMAGLLSTALKDVLAVPEDLAEALRSRRLNYRFWEDRHRFFVGQAISALCDAKITPILIKGTASAYSIYGAAADRIRGDTDILVAPNFRVQADEILVDLGFERSVNFARARGANQLGYTREENVGWSHEIDLHWQVSNSAFLSQLFTWDELFLGSILLPSLCDGARAPSHVNSLLITCFHRLVHLSSPYSVNGTQHYSSDRLIWLADINLLARALTPEDWTVFVQRAHEKGLSSICMSGLTAAHATFETEIPQDVWCKLAASTDPSQVDIYLNGSNITQFRLNMASQSSLWGKFSFIGEHIFPPKSYMHAQFGEGPLIALYLRRGMRGISKLRARGPDIS